MSSMMLNIKLKKSESGYIIMNYQIVTSNFAKVFLKRALTFSALCG